MAVPSVDVSKENRGPIDVAPQFSMKMFATKILLCQAAATVSESATFPLDLLKTRLMIQGEKSKNALAKSQPQRGMLGVAKGIVMEEGFFCLWRGLPPALYRHYIYTASRMSIYEVLRDYLGHDRRQNNCIPIWQSAMCGMLAGGAAQFLASPADLVKVQVQMEGKRILMGHRPRYEGPFYFGAFRDIYRERGIRGLWRGVAPNVQRACLVNMGDLTTYDTVKKWLLRNTSLSDTSFTHVLSSCCAGMVAALLSTPADVVKTRIMNQPYDEMGRGKLYRSSVDCLVKTVKSEGFLALYKGFVPIYIRMGPWSLIFWVSYEKIRFLTGVGGF